jgi:hypothetical protein
MSDFEKLLAAGDLRSTGNVDTVISRVKNQADFDELFALLQHKERALVMRTSDAVEKITLSRPEYLSDHKKAILQLLTTATNKELMWHIAMIAVRIKWNDKDFALVWDTFHKWLYDKGNSKLVRVAAVQGLYELTRQHKALLPQFKALLPELEEEKIASLNARIRNIRKEFVG